MKDGIEYYGLCAALILAGILLYGIGNLAFGKKQHGGKRLILLVFGVCASGMGGLLIAASVVFWSDGTSRIFVCLLFAAGLALVGSGGYATWLSFSGDNAKIEKAFDSLLGGL